MLVSRLLLASCVAACTRLATAGLPDLIELGHHVPGMLQPGYAGLVVGDFDGDGLDDIVVPGMGGGAVLNVIGQRAGAIAIKQTVFVPGEAGYIVRVMRVSAPGTLEILTVSENGQARRYAGWPLAEVDVVETGVSPVSSAAVGDIDNDGEFELVLGSDFFPPQLHVHALADGAMLWERDTGDVGDVLLAQLDGDPALEIVTASVPGLVLDGATQAVDWSYPDGFADLLASGRFPASGEGQFVALSSFNAFVVFQGAPWSPLWEFPVGYAAAVAAADLDGDGLDEILVGESSLEHGVRVVDSTTHTVRLSVPLGSDNGISAVAGWDHDGDGVREIAFTTILNNGVGDELFRAADSEDGTLVWQMLQDVLGSYASVAIGDLGHPSPSLLFAARGDMFGAQAGGWTQLGALDGAQQWRSPAPTGENADPYDMMGHRVRILGNGSGETRILLAGVSSNDGIRFISLDPATHAVQWVQDNRTIPTLLNRNLQDTREVELDTGPAIASCTWAGTGETKLLLMDAASGEQLWESVSMGGGFDRCKQVLAGRFVDGAQPLLLAVLDNSIRAYGAESHLLEWIMSVTCRGASLVEHGESGRELVVMHATGLRFYDAATRDLLRQFALDVPADAVEAIEGDIHRLVVAAGGRLLLVDGIDGTILQASDFIGDGLGEGNQLALYDMGGNSHLIGAGSYSGVFRYRLTLDERIFKEGFEPAVE